MRRLALALALTLALLLVGGVLVERAVLAKARAAGVRWASMRRGSSWVFTDLERGPIHAEELRWSPSEPGRVVLHGIDLDLATLKDAAGPSEGSGEAAVELPPLEIALSGLRVRYGDRVLAEDLHGVIQEGEGRIEGKDLLVELPGPEGARASVKLRRPIPSERLRGDVDLELLWTDPPRATLSAETLTLEDPLLAPQPLVLHGLRAELSGDPDARVATGTLWLGALQAELRMDCAADCVAELVLPETPVADALAPLAPLVPELARAELRGEVSGLARLFWEGGEPRLQVEPKLGSLRVRGAVQNLEALRGGVVEYPVTASDGSRRLRPLGEGAAGWTPLREVSPILIGAVIASEDAGFRGHAGYSPGAIAEAIARNREAGKVVRGGSTLTQQLAKNLFLDGSRTFQRKLRELLLAAELDASLGKERVMELYLNAVEWGPDFWGVAAACDRYFLKKPANIAPNEAAFLAALLPNPRGYYQWWYLEQRPNRQVVTDILGRMAQGGTLTHEEAERWAAQPLHFVPPPR